MADLQRKTGNLFDGTYTKGFIGTTYIYKNTGTSANCAIIPCEPSTTYTIKKHDESNRFAIGTSNVLPYDEIQLTGVYYVDTATEYTFTTDSSAHYMVVYVSTGTEQAEPRLMVNIGITPLPYEPYGWQHSLRKLGTSTDTITTLPADIYADGTNATVGLVGNMSQTGTPTPQNPIQPQECGDLETEGAKAGQYKIPISSASTTTPVYLGEVESTRQIKKYELTGQESDLRIQASITATNAIQLPTTLSDYKRESFVCSHMPIIDSSTNPNTHGFVGQFLTLCFELSMGLDTLEKVRTYLQQQYAAGTPVTVWYVLATETTGIVNEPLRKIGDYADTVSGITIPITTGKDTFDVQTTLKPSEVELTYTGWHDAYVKEWDGSDWK